MPTTACRGYRMSLSKVLRVWCFTLNRKVIRVLMHPIQNRTDPAESLGVADVDDLTIRHEQPGHVSALVLESVHKHHRITG